MLSEPWNTRERNSAAGPDLLYIALASPSVERRLAACGVASVLNRARTIDNYAVITGSSYNTYYIMALV